MRVHYVFQALRGLLVQVWRSNHGIILLSGHFKPFVRHRTCLFTGEDSLPYPVGGGQTGGASRQTDHGDTTVASQFNKTAGWGVLRGRGWRDGGTSAADSLGNRPFPNLRQSCAPQPFPTRRQALQKNVDCPRCGGKWIADPGLYPDLYIPKRRYPRGRIVKFATSFLVRCARIGYKAKFYRKPRERCLLLWREVGVGNVRRTISGSHSFHHEVHNRR
mmetsp:Transcript_15080/g.42914  ORF Transcript_15080/g.42914 Transcript_15080/m.42914 type:complete len:218 (-) Transcript_15080:1939-2592(-)